jgi:signal recognition particle receptor subunit beta
MKTDKTVIILRGASGAGKTFAAKTIRALNPSRCVIVSADDYFIGKDGVFRFDGSKISNAHTDCFNKYMAAIDNPGVEVVVVANTNTKEWEFSRYKDFAENKDIPCVFLVVEHRHDSDHRNAPDDVTQLHVKNIKSTLKLSNLS